MCTNFILLMKKCSKLYTVKILWYVKIHIYSCTIFQFSKRIGQLNFGKIYDMTLSNKNTTLRYIKKREIYAIGKKYYFLFVLSTI